MMVFRLSGATLHAQPRGTAAPKRRGKNDWTRLNGNGGLEQTADRCDDEAVHIGRGPFVAGRYEDLTGENGNRRPAMDAGETFGAELDVVTGRRLTMVVLAGLVGPGPIGMLAGERRRDELQQ